MMNFLHAGYISLVVVMQSLMLKILSLCFASLFSNFDCTGNLFVLNFYLMKILAEHYSKSCPSLQPFVLVVSCIHTN